MEDFNFTFGEYEGKFVYEFKCPLCGFYNTGITPFAGATTVTIKSKGTPFGEYCVDCDKHVRFTFTVSAEEVKSSG